jgi:SAM-dependent methyltransferase
MTGMATDLGTTMATIALRLGSYKDDVDLTVHGADDMYIGDLDAYIQVGHSAIACIAAAMAMAGRTELAAILDLPCGYGRVLRMLRAAFPEADITACDIQQDAVAFCAARFGARPVPSANDPREIPIGDQFDLVWCGSLITHLSESRSCSFLDWFVERLRPEGMLLFSVHGRDAVRRWRAQGDARLGRVARDFERRGYGYRDHAGVSGYGTSACRPSWVAAQLERRDDVCLLFHAERGWDDFHDIVAVVKRDPHHRQDAFVNV